jgi:hypothetical protein
MQVNKEHSIAFPAVKKGITLKIVLKGKEEEEQEPKLISSTSMPKKICFMKEAKPKEAG